KPLQDYKAVYKLQGACHTPSLFCHRCLQRQTSFWDKTVGQGWIIGGPFRGPFGQKNDFERL
ncbi:MAG TPA: hypothetical protein DEB46_09975, partial [Myxococcales bacterium]|nr:hypothetical protein [Myxococcales bacterium]